MTAFEFSSAGRIIFGAGSAGQAGLQAAKLGKRALVVAGVGQDLLKPLLDDVHQNKLESVQFTVQAEPTVELVQRGLALARQAMADLVIGVGGGSALDAGKAIAALLANPGDVLDFLEVVGRGLPLSNPAVPYIAIPTTAGTGSEVTQNAVLTAPALDDPTQNVKVSLRSPYMLPRVSLVDPQLTLRLPPEITASTGMDALTQLIEPFVSVKANPFTDALCREGMRRAARSLLRAYELGSDLLAREDMCVASLFGGLALANGKLGAVHGFAAPLGGMYQAAHGAVCAALLPHVMEMNICALQDRIPHSSYLSRYAEIAVILTGDPQAEAMDSVIWVKRICRELAIPGLRAYGVSPGDFPVLVERAARASSMQGNPLKLTDEELQRVLQSAL